MRRREVLLTAARSVDQLILLGLALLPFLMSLVFRGCEDW